MRLFTSLLLTSLLLASVVALPANSAPETQSNAFNQHLQLAQRRGKSRHRGSGRIEFVSLSDVHIS